MPEERSYISKVTLPSGNTYYLKDSEARELIEALERSTHYLGVTTTALTDGATTNPITVSGQSITAVSGDIVLANNGREEFIFNGTKWQLFGDLSVLGALAYKDSASGSGTVSVPATFSASFTGTEKNVSVSGTTAGSVSLTKAKSNVTANGTGTGGYTPAGTNSTSSVSGSCTVTPSGSITKGTGTANYTPQGNVTAPTISVGTPGATTSVNSITDVGTLPSCTLPTYTVSNEVLTITAGSFSAGTLPTKGSNTTVKTGDASYTATAPTFNGTGVELKFTGTSSTGTISGTAAAQTFTGTNVTLKTNDEVATGASFTGGTTTSTGKYTPEGSVSVGIATNTNKTINVTVS